MRGFFSDNKLKNTSTKLRSLPECGKCQLYKKCSSPKMEPYGDGGKKILIIGTAPGQVEDANDIPLSNSFIRSRLRAVGVDYEKDCLTINSISCVPQSGKYDREIDSCRPKVWKVIRDFKPKLILLFGTAAVHSFLGHRMSKGVGSIEQWRGWVIPDREVNCWVAPMYSPKMFQEDGDVADLIFHDDLVRALERMEDPMPEYSNEEEAVTSLTDTKAIKKYLRSLSQDEDATPIAIDYETTGLKPHMEGHRIVTCAFSEDGKTATAFPVTDDIKDDLCDFLESPREKVAANAKFEEMWTRVILDCSVNNWYFDTMIAGHVLDNRPAITSVKFQGYVQFGILDYAIKFVSESANAFNNIDDIEIEDLLVYNGMDVIIEWNLFDKQIKELEERELLDAYDLFHEGMEALCDVEELGICIDMEYLEETRTDLEKKSIDLQEKIKQTDLGKLWLKIYKGTYNLDSDVQLRAILFKHMGIEPTKYTKNEAPSVDGEALKKMNLPAVENILEYRTCEKMLSTYLGGIHREQVLGILHCFFHLHTVRTMRGSSSDVNFQNQPIRDPVMGKTIRQCFIPSEGNQILELDFKGIEVSIAYCYHKDPTMYEYITNPENDMHRDMAAACYMLERDEVTKEARYCGKNMFVFPQFYGDYFIKCAKSLWEAISKMKLKTVSGTPLKKHLQSKGIRSLKQFETHLKKVEDDFWNVRFPVYTEWKEEWYEEYLEKGWFRMYTGFICSGLMRKNQVINYPVQGPAFHCLLWSLIQLNKWLIQKDMNSGIIGQIHDSIIIDLDPEEKDEILKQVKLITTKDLQRQFKWIIIPLEIEAEITPVDGTWYDKEEIKI